VATHRIVKGFDIVKNQGPAPGSGGRNGVVETFGFEGGPKGFGGLLTPTSVDQFPWFVGVMLAMFFFTGIGNTATFRQYPVIFAHSPRQAAGVIGFTAAIAAYGPFLFSMLLGWSKSASGTFNAFFIGLLAYCVMGTAINWCFYSRNGAEKPS